MVAEFDLDNTIPDWALCFRWDIVLRGREATPLDTDKTLTHVRNHAIANRRAVLRLWPRAEGTLPLGSQRHL